MQSRIIEADEESEKWERLANIENEARMKAINYALRDAFASHSRQLTEIVQALQDFSRLGEGLESDVTLLRTLQADLTQVSGSDAPPRKSLSLLARTKQGLSLLQQDLTLSAEQLKLSGNKLSDLTIANRRYDQRVRQLVAFIGDPQGRIEQWEKQVAQTEVDNNSKEATELANVAALGARIENAIAALDNATKSLQLVIILKHRRRPRLGATSRSSGCCLKNETFAKMSFHCDAHHSNKRTGELSIRFVELSMTERHSIPDRACFDNGPTISCFMLKTTSTTAAYYNKGLSCLKMGDFAEAITQLRSAAEPYWGDEDTLAALCLAIDETEAEDSTFDASMAKLWSLPDGAAFQRALAIDCHRCGLYLDAIVYALRSVLIAPDDVISIYVLARSYLAAGMYEEAKTSFRRALELEPDFRIARSRLNSL